MSWATIGPVTDDRFHVTFLHCAQQCAHPIAAIGLHRNLELVARHGLSVKAAVFQTGIICELALHRNICRIRKCLRAVYLQFCGEVAERLKAAVC